MTTCCVGVDSTVTQRLVSNESARLCFMWTDRIVHEREGFRTSERSKQPAVVSQR